MVLKPEGHDPPAREAVIPVPLRGGGEDGTAAGWLFFANLPGSASGMCGEPMFKPM